MAVSTTWTPHKGLKTRTFSPKTDDSPSRQLMLELEAALSQVEIHEVELHKVHAYDRRSYYEGLERRENERTQEDLEALDAATARHDAVRRVAEAELNEYYRQVEEQERRKREEAERKLREQQARDRAEREKRLQEEAERRAKLEQQKRAAAKKAAEEKAKADAEEKERREREEAAARIKAEKERAIQEEAAKAEAARRATEQQAAHEASAQQAEADAKAKAQFQTTAHLSQNEARHQRYLEIHQRLKVFRKDFVQQSKSIPALKTKLGDMRRAIKKSVGQLTGDKEANKLPVTSFHVELGLHANGAQGERIQKTLQDARKMESPQVDVREFIAQPPLESQHPSQCQVPGLGIYLLNMFSKSVISQFASESAVSPMSAEPVGVLVVQIFSNEEFFHHGRTMIDILLAKFHLVCPVLWDIYGDEQTPVGKLRLGWRRQQGQFVADQTHAERMNGFGAGFAAIALRNFSKVRSKNPFPPTNYWECLANIVNVPPSEVELTHLYVLKTMVENSTSRFILFFDGAAIAALRHALVEFPARLRDGTRESAASKSINLLVESLHKDKNLSLA